MRVTLIGVLFVLAGSVAAQETTERAAEKVLAAFRANDDAALKVLAAKEEPSPWLVADRLCFDGESAAARAFAAAAPRPDTRKLPAYVAAWKADPRLRAARGKIQKAYAEARAGRNDAALALLPDDLPAGTVTAVLDRNLRAVCLYRLGRIAESTPQFAAAGEAAAAIGFHKFAARSFMKAASSASQRSEQATAIRWWGRAREVHEARGDVRAAWNLMTLIGNAHTARGDFASARTCFGRLRDLAKAAGRSDVVAYALNGLGNTERTAGNHGAAAPLLALAAKLGGEVGDERLLLTVLTNLAVVRFELGEYEASAGAASRAAELARKRGDRRTLGVTLNVLGGVALRRGRFLRCRDLCRQAAALAEETKDTRGYLSAIGNVGNAYWKLGDLRRAEGAQKKVLALRIKAFGPDSVASTLLNLGLVYRERDWPRAIEFTERARAMAEKTSDGPVVLSALLNLANARRALGEHETSRDLLLRALALVEQQPNARRLADVLTALGSAHASLGDGETATGCFDRARAALGTGATLERAHSLALLALTLRDAGEHERALDVNRQALAIYEKVGTPVEVAGRLAQIGANLAALGDLPAARAHFDRAFALFKEQGDDRATSWMLQALGATYAKLGRYGEATDFLSRLIERDRSQGIIDRQPKLFSSLAALHGATGNYAEALRLGERALDVARAQKNPAAEAIALNGLAGAFSAIGDVASALPRHERALAISEKLGDRRAVAIALGNLGQSFAALGQEERALVYHERALAEARKLADRGLIAFAIKDLAEFRRRQGDLDAAARLLADAIRIQRAIDAHAELASALCALATIRGEQRRGERARALFREALGHAREVGSVRWEVRALAGLANWGTSEECAAHARAAVELLPRLWAGLAEAESGAAREEWAWLFEAGAKAALRLDDPALFSYFVEAGRAGALLELLQNRAALRADTVPAALRHEEDAARAAERVAQWRYDKTRREGRRPDRAALEKARTRLVAVTRRIQREAKAAGRALYPEVAGLDELRKGLAPDEALVQYLVGTVTAAALVATAEKVHLVDLGEPAAIEKACGAVRARVGRPRGLTQRAKAPSLDADALRRLVFAPLRLDARVKRVFVSPDGGLASVPFALLAGTRDVVYVPSGTARLRLTRAASGARVLAVGDPDYGVEARPEERAEVQRAGTLAALPGTRVEVKAVGDVVMLGKEATVERLREALATNDRWRSVHLACHGLIQPERPAFSSLALTGGYLKCMDVYRMRLVADLVVLSACETAKGKSYRAEGVIGFPRAFLLAGASSVLVSLWKVDDEATSELMVKFYELWKAGGVPVATALRQAQEHVRGQPKWGHPFYWAAWQLWGGG